MKAVKLMMHVLLLKDEINARKAAAAEKREQEQRKVQERRREQLKKDMEDEKLMSQKQEYLQQLKVTPQCHFFIS